MNLRKMHLSKAISAGGEKNQVIYNLLGICGMKLNDYKLCTGAV